MIRRSLCAFALFLAVAGCGYHVAGYGENKRTFYISQISNTSDDYTVNRDIERNITRFLQIYGMLESQSEADYIMRVTLVQKRITSPIRSSTKEALTSNMELTYLIIVEDKQGAVLYNRQIMRNQNYATGSDIKSYSKSEQDAFEELTDTIFTEFKYDFNAP